MKQNEIMQLAKAELPQLKAIIGLNTSKGTDVETLALQELEYLQQVALTKPEIYECEPITIIMAIKKTLKQNLSLDPDAGLTYIKTRNFKAKDEKGQDVWKKALEITPSANGIISINRQCGRILDIERPEVIKDDKGKVTGVKVKYLVPSYNEEGKRAFKWRTVEFDESDFNRWKAASHKENGRGKQDADIQKLNYANANYTSFKGGPDPEFVRAKAIRHGLKKLGTNQNETRSVNIDMTPVKNIVDLSADEQVVSDEYISHEDVGHEVSGNGTTANGNEVTATKVETPVNHIEIPDEL